MSAARFTVVPGVEEPLAAIAGHGAVPGIDRVRLATGASIPGRSFHVAAHLIRRDYAPHHEWRFTEIQRHAVDEINLLIPTAGRFRYRYEVEGAIHEVAGPCSVFLPAGVAHRMEPIEGTGVFVCIKLDGEGGDA